MQKVLRIKLLKEGATDVYEHDSRKMVPQKGRYDLAFWEAIFYVINADRDKNSIIRRKLFCGRVLHLTKYFLAVTL